MFKDNYSTHKDIYSIIKTGLPLPQPLSSKTRKRPVLIRSLSVYQITSKNGEIVTCRPHYGALFSSPQHKKKYHIYTKPIFSDLFCLLFGYFEITKFQMSWKKRFRNFFRRRWCFLFLYISPCVLYFAPDMGASSRGEVKITHSRRIEIRRQVRPPREYVFDTF